MVRMTVLTCHTASVVAKEEGDVEGETLTAWRQSGRLFQSSRQEIDWPRRRHRKKGVESERGFKGWTDKI